MVDYRDLARLRVRRRPNGGGSPPTTSPAYLEERSREIEVLEFVPAAVDLMPDRSYFFEPDSKSSKCMCCWLRHCRDRPDGDRAFHAAQRD